MRRARNAAGRRSPAAAAARRVSLSLPAEPAAVPLAENAARGLLTHRNGSGVTPARLAAVSAELVAAGLSGARKRDRVWLHYDVGSAEIAVTVELRRRAWRGAGPSFTRSLAIPPGGTTPSHPRR